jgi:hypothetical protein
MNPGQECGDLLGRSKQRLAQVDAELGVEVEGFDFESRRVLFQSFTLANWIRVTRGGVLWHGSNFGRFDA